MKILFLHGWSSTPGGLKPTYLRNHGHEVLNPLLPDDEFAAVLNDPLNEVHVLHVDGSPAGFAELDRRQPDEIELVQFGLMPDFIGQGSGRWFLQWTIDKVWVYQPRRFWLHTCTLDHPAAVPTYKNAGFVQYKVEQIRREL